MFGALLVTVQAWAQVADGVCLAGSPEATKGQCATLGLHVLEIAPPSGGTFPVTGTCTVGESQKSCAFWPYRFSGPRCDTILDILIPTGLDIYSSQTYPPTTVVFRGCQYVYLNGQGDPTTGFGKGIITYNTCRIALNVDAGPGTPNFVLATALSSPGPLPVQLKRGRSDDDSRQRSETSSAGGAFFDDILGPFTPGVPRLSSTSQSITTLSGAVLSVVTDQTGGLVSATSNTGPVTVIPPGIAVLCTPVNPSNTYPNNFPTQYDCGPIVENLDGTNLQAGLNSTCYYRRSDGTLLKYTC